MANARSTGSCTLLKIIHEIAVTMTAARQAAKKTFTLPLPSAIKPTSLYCGTVHQALRKSSGNFAIFTAILRASSAVRSWPDLWLTLLFLCDQLDEAFHRLNLLAFAIVEFWIVAPVDGRA